MWNRRSQQIDLQRGLIGYWPFRDQTARDYSGFNNHGSLVASPKFGVGPMADLAQGCGGAFSFDGSTQYIDTGAGFSTAGLTEFTIVVPVWHNSAAGNQRAISNSHTDSDNSGFHIVVGSTFQFDVGNGTTFDGVNTGVPFALGQWDLLICQVSATNITIFKNDVNVGTNGTSPVPLNAGTGNLFFGAAVYLGDFFNGKLGPIWTYNRVLSQAEKTFFYQWMRSGTFPQFDFRLSDRVGLSTTIALAARSLIAVMSRAATPTGTVSISGRSQAAIKSRANPTVAMPLSGSSAIGVKSKALLSAAAALSARSSVAVKSSALFSGTVALAAASAIRVFSRLTPPGSVALFAKAMIKVTARAGLSATAALSASSKIAIFSRLVPPGSIALFAATMIKIVSRAATPAGSAALQARTKISVSTAAAITGKTSLAALSKIAVAAKANLSATANLGAASAIRVFARAATPIGTVALGARSAVRVMARGAISIAGGVFILSARVITAASEYRRVKPTEPARRVTPSSEDREI